MLDARAPTLDGLPFRFGGTAHFFEKAGAPAGMQRRVGGVVSTQARDRQGEIVLQRGLDFSEYETNGWINDNHGKDTDSLIGFPDGKVLFFKKGEVLPSGMPAPNDCHWHEGFLLQGDDRADKLWKKAIALQGTGRSLGWSIEGKVLRRQGADKKTIAQALVKHVALTAVPVNTETQLDVLVKSMHAAETLADDAWLDLLNKALSVGTPAQPGSPPVGPQSGAGAGQVLARESLEHDAKDPQKRKKKRISKSEAFEYLFDRYPNISAATAGRIIDLTLARTRKEAIP